MKSQDGHRVCFCRWAHTWYCRKVKYVSMKTATTNKQEQQQQHQPTNITKVVEQTCLRQDVASRPMGSEVVGEPLEVVGRGYPNAEHRVPQPGQTNVAQLSSHETGR